MEPRIIKILGPRRPLACIPGVAPEWFLASSSRSLARRDRVVKGRGVPQGPSGAGQSRVSSGFSGTTFRAALTSAIPRFLPFCSWPARPYFLQEPLPAQSATGPVSSRRLRGSTRSDRSSSDEGSRQLLPPPPLGSARTVLRAARLSSAPVAAPSAGLLYYRSAHYHRGRVNPLPAHAPRPRRLNTLACPPKNPAELGLCRRSPRSAWITRHCQ